MAVQVLYPPVFDQFLKLLKNLKSQGINLVPKVFEGIYQGKKYPRAYTKEQKGILISLIEQSGNVNFAKEILLGSYCFKGKLCSTGKDRIVIQANGSALRCKEIASF